MLKNRTSNDSNRAEQTPLHRTRNTHTGGGSHPSGTNQGPHCVLGPLPSAPRVPWRMPRIPPQPEEGGGAKSLTRRTSPNTRAETTRTSGTGRVTHSLFTKKYHRSQRVSGTDGGTRHAGEEEESQWPGPESSDTQPPALLS